MKYLKQSLNRFIKLETSSSIILFVATIAALILANSSLSESFLGFWENQISIRFPGFELSKPIIKWINDGLMAVFFFLIGLEIKREIMVGELSRLKKASLPIFAAIGGMLIPAFLFILLNRGNPGNEGWGIPTATDIAFTLGVLQILGKRIPSGLKVFLMAFAIIDDLGAVLIIAFFYSSKLVWSNIAIGLIILTLLFILSRKGQYSKYIFLIAGLVVWVLFLKSGIHATIAGVLMALTIPIKRKIDSQSYYTNGKTLLENFHHTNEGSTKSVLLSNDQIEALDELEGLTEQISSPLQHLEHQLHGWVSYLIMPLFALANAGVVFNFSGDTNLALSANIGTSMVLGKTVGIFLFSYFAIRLGFSELPENVSYTQIAGIAILGGLGFTMSLFINNLAYSDIVLINSAKIGIIIGSLLAGIVGFLVLKFGKK